MSERYRDSKDIPNSVLADRLDALSDAVTKGREAVAREFTMRVPAEHDRDADLVLSEAAERIRRADLAAERERELSVRIYNHGYKAGHHDTVESVYTDIHEADMSSYHSDEVGELLSDLATQPHSREGGEEK